MRAVVLLDDEDWPKVSHLKWHFSHGYAIAHDGPRSVRRTVSMHRLIVDAPPGMEVDHIDGDKLNNCRRNLRVVDHAINMNNVGSNQGASSAYRGVSWNKKLRKWTASYRGRYIASFASEIDAAQAAAHARGEL